MATSLYDLTVTNYLQELEALGPILAKGRAYCGEKDLSVDALLEKRLADDMLPLSFQLHMATKHSIDAISGLREGKFAPPRGLEDLDYAGFEKQVADTTAALRALDPGEVESLAGKDIIFSIGDMEMPFTAENFVMSFSLPNFYFHTTTAYAILRAEGVPLGKRDYLGRMRITA